jgi:hypothetical protein
MGNWIKSAIKKPGALTAQAKRAGQSPMAFAKAHASDKGLTGRRARLAETLAGFRRKGKFKKTTGRETPKGAR